MTSWDGEDRRKQNRQDHDVVIRIEETLRHIADKLDARDKLYEKNEKDNEERFALIEERFNKFNKAYFMGVGVLLAVNLGSLSFDKVLSHLTK